ncbi:hypothetical protein GDO81_027659 [Engystomops pustulosus]|uniref:Uncharacterized protein n=1 Tax=Engystomops pustulosus TaxID=76066 RepID=A0AAV6ZK51_ENGPU|nr:hypothetical protein GDO81_027659 [Engystomops pustulosus]
MFPLNIPTIIVNKVVLYNTRHHCTLHAAGSATPYNGLFNIHNTFLCSVKRRTSSDCARGSHYYLFAL